MKLDTLKESLEHDAPGSAEGDRTPDHHAERTNQHNGRLGIWRRSPDDHRPGVLDGPEDVETTSQAVVLVDDETGRVGLCRLRIPTGAIVAPRFQRRADGHLGAVEAV